MIDFHCHLDLYPDALQVMRQASARNEFTFVVTTSPRGYQATSRVFAGQPRIHVGLGLHPEVAEAKAGEERLLVQLIASSRLVGEIGLDGSSRFRHSLALQKRIFTAAIAECARQGGRVISIHSRGAATAVLDVLEAHPHCGKPVLHWFTGSQRELERAIDLGCWFSVGPAMLSSASGRKLAAQMPLDRVLPETDGPFTTIEGKTLMPWQAADVAHFFAQQHSVSDAQLQSRFRSNLRELVPMRPGS